MVERGLSFFPALWEFYSEHGFDTFKYVGSSLGALLEEPGFLSGDCRCVTMGGWACQMSGRLGNDAPRFLFLHCGRFTLSMLSTLSQSLVEFRVFS